MLFCVKCKTVHDFDIMPDTGECFFCHSPLAENEEEVVDENEFSRLIAESFERLEIIRSRSGKKSVDKS